MLILLSKNKPSSDEKLTLSISKKYFVFTEEENLRIFPSVKFIMGFGSKVSISVFGKINDNFTPASFLSISAILKVQADLDSLTVFRSVLAESNLILISEYDDLTSKLLSIYQHGHTYFSLGKHLILNIDIR